MIQKETWMRIAELMASESKAVNAKVGCVAVRGDRIVATGINGTPTGRDNTCEDDRGITKAEVVHAEINILAFAAKHGINLNDCDIYVTLSPCSACAAALSTAGIRRWYYRNTYRNTDGLHLLADMNIPVEQLNVS